VASRDDPSPKLQAALETEVDTFLMSLQRLGGILGAPVQRFRYPHFYLPSGTHFNSRGAKVRQGRSEILPFLYEFPRFITKQPLLGTGIGWLSLKEFNLETVPAKLDRPAIGTLGDKGGALTLRFPLEGIGGACESIEAEFIVHNFNGQPLTSGSVAVGFWNDGLLPQARCLHFDESGQRFFVGSKVVKSENGKTGGLASYSAEDGQQLWYQPVSAGAIALSPNQRQLLVVTAGGTAVVDAKTGQLKHRSRERDHGGAFTPLSTQWMDDRVATWLGGQDFIAIGGVEASGAVSLQLREAKSSQMIWELPLDNTAFESPRSESKACAAPNRFIRSLSASPCGRLLAFVAGDLYLVDGGNGELLQVISARDGVHTWEGADFSPDGTMLAVASHELLVVFDCQKAKSQASGKPSSAQFLRRIASFWTS